jgi:hypothetical protein
VKEASEVSIASKPSGCFGGSPFKKVKKANTRGLGNV